MSIPNSKIGLRLSSSTVGSVPRVLIIVKIMMIPKKIRMETRLKLIDMSLKLEQNLILFMKRII